jgi:alpha-L-fucosidase
MTKKDFPTLAVLSVTSGRLLTQPKEASEGNGIDRIYEVLEWMSDNLPFTYQLVRFTEECKSWIYRQHPEIIKADKWIENKLIEKCEAEDVKDCQTAMLAKFGEVIALKKIPQGYHNFKNL